MAYRYRGMGTVQDDISAAAGRYGVPSSLALAVAQRESGFNQSARGTSGEIGVFQIMPGTANDLGVNPGDLGQNIDGGVRYLSQLYRQFGDWRIALQAYNGGPGNVTRGTVSSAAQGYADSVLAASGIDSASDDVSGPLDGSDYPGPADAAGLSGVALAGLGLAAAGLFWLVLD